MYKVQCSDIPGLYKSVLTLNAARELIKIYTKVCLIKYVRVIIGFGVLLRSNTAQPTVNEQNHTHGRKRAKEKFFVEQRNKCEGTLLGLF